MLAVNAIMELYPMATTLLKTKQEGRQLFSVGPLDLGGSKQPPDTSECWSQPVTAGRGQMRVWR